MCKVNLKIFTTIVICFLLVLSVGFAVKKPKMHNPLQINVIEYFLKINSDGSVTTTKSVTTNVIKEK